MSKLNDVFERFSWLLDIDCADLLEDIVDQEYKEDMDELSVEFIIFIFIKFISWISICVKNHFP